MRINYVIATWSGWRRSGDDRSDADPTRILRTHIESLARVRHSFTDVTVVAPYPAEHAEPESPAFLELLGGLPHRVIRRPNIAGSYGSWTEAYRQTRGQYDAYIFVEDDYVFVQDDFDQLLVNRMCEARVELVCGLVLPFQGVDHPAVALILCDAAAMARWDDSCPLPCDMTEQHSYQQAEHWQAQWGRDFQQLGLRMADWIGPWATPYWTADRYLRWYGERHAPPLVMPVQALDRTTHREAPDQSWHDLYTWPPA